MLAYRLLQRTPELQRGDLLVSRGRRLPEVTRRGPTSCATRISAHGQPPLVVVDISATPKRSGAPRAAAQRLRAPAALPRQHAYPDRDRKRPARPTRSSGSTRSTPSRPASESAVTRSHFLRVSVGQTNPGKTPGPPRYRRPAPRTHARKRRRFLARHEHPASDGTDRSRSIDTTLLGSPRRPGAGCGCERFSAASYFDLKKRVRDEDGDGES